MTAARPTSLSELKQFIVSTGLRPPQQQERVARLALAHPEIVAFGTAHSVADRCVVSPSGYRTWHSANGKVVLLEVVSRPRARQAKADFYRELSVSLNEKCRISSSDLMVSFVENSDEDWSFGNGEAQFLTGDL